MKNSRNQGFTLVELTVALAFLSILLIAILTLTLTAGNLYVKGTTIKSINQSWRDIEDMMRRDMLASDPTLMTPVITVGSGAAKSARICLGSVSYVWNTAGLLNATSPPPNTVATYQGKPIRLARFFDSNKTLCTPTGAGRYPIVITVEGSELLAAGGREVAVYSADMGKVSVTGKTAIYSVKMTIGTSGPNTTELDTTGGYTRCKPNGTTTSDFNYCSVSDFDMMVRVGGGGLDV